MKIGPDNSTACGHGTPWDKQCVDCEIVWEAECFERAKADMAKHAERLAMFKRIRAAPTSGPATAPASEPTDG